MFTISGEFDSANPRQNGIEQLTQNSFVLRPFSETLVESFKFDIKIYNNTSEKQNIKLEIIWPTKSFSELRDCFYWQQETVSDWECIPASTKPGYSYVTFEVPSGTGILSLHPHYGYDDCDKFIAALNHPLLQKNITNKSEEGRNIWLLQASALIKSKPEKRFLISARNHANESSGNYCVEGMLQWLLSNDPLAKYALTQHEFYFIPMSNPDGVAKGMARHTCKNHCIDLNKTPKWYADNAPDIPLDKTFYTYYRMIDEIQPTHFMNLHSYLFKFQDELYVLSQENADCFFKFMPNQIEFNKIWKTTLNNHSLFPTGYCYEKYRTLPLLAEIPWFGRNATAMRLTGKRLLKAFIMMNTVGETTWGNI